MRILLIYPGATWSPYDVATGYEAALRALGHEVFVFNYHTEYEYTSSYLAYLSREHGLTFPADAARVLASERVTIAIVDRRPDVILNVMGFSLHQRAYVHAHILGVPMAVILTESPYADEQQADMLRRNAVAMAFTNDKSSVGPLSQLCISTQIHYLPHSFNPGRHYPHQVNGDYGTDVFFYGTLWPERKALLDQLDLSAYNASVGLTLFDRESGEMPQVIENDDMTLWYSGTKIAINHHRTALGDGSGYVVNPYSLGPRAFEISACGAFQLCDDARPELWDVFKGSVATYSDADDLQGKIEHYLHHDRARKQMAAAALDAVQPCSFMNRAQEIVVPALEQLV